MLHEDLKQKRGQKGSAKCARRARAAKHEQEVEAAKVRHYDAANHSTQAPTCDMKLIQTPTSLSSGLLRL